MKHLRLIFAVLACFQLHGQYFPPGGSSVAGGSVGGGDSLTNAGAISYVSAAGTLAEMSGWVWGESVRDLYINNSAAAILTVSGNPVGDQDQSVIFGVNAASIATPPSVAGAFGTTPGDIVVQGLTGGITSIATTGTAARGSTVSILSGRGGPCSSSTTACTSGDGGNVTFGANDAGVVNASGGVNVGGVGGILNLYGGNGGPSTNGSTNTGGNGGSIVAHNGSGGTGATANGLDGTFRVEAGGRANSPSFKIQSNAGAADFLEIDATGDTLISQALITDGAAPTVGAGSCTGATIGTGSKMMAGTITGTPTATCTVTLTFPVEAPTGWSCAISNQTTANLIRQTASSTTVVTFVGVTVASDVLRYGPCMAH